MSEVILVRADQTCGACMSQWDAWDLDGRYWYLRFRHGRGTMDHTYLGDALSFKVSYEETGLDGYISLDEFCQRIGVTYAPGLADRVSSFEATPPC